MITVEQCRAARGILGWTQGDLAEATGISKTSINNFERGLTNVKSDTLQVIKSAFNNNDIEFTPPHGVNKKIHNLKAFHGKGANQMLWDDIFESLSKEGGEVLISGVNEKKSLDADKEGLYAHIARLNDNNIMERMLAKEGDRTFVQPRECYRWLPEEAIEAMAPTFIYGDTVAIKLWEEEMIVVIKSKSAAEAERKKFNYFWEKGRVPPAK